MTAALIVTAAVFALLCGANDGGALLSLALRHRTSGVLALTVMGTAVLVGPGLFGLAVARTFTSGLGPATGAQGGEILLGGAVAATGLVLVLTRRGIPTSITLALLGALAGATVAFGAAPAWGHLGLVLAIGAAAPAVGVAAGYALGTLARRVPAAPRMSGAVRAVQLLAFTGQCLAYAANDGQKMFALAAVAAAAAGHPGGLDAGGLPSLGISVMVALIFTAGSTLSLRRISGGATTALVSARPWQVLSAEVASSAAVLGTAGMGVPVSMTQSTAGGLVGAGLSEGRRRVRWQFAVPLGVAWLVTLPAAFASGLAVAGAVRVAGLA